jgi:hypothetical protein
MEAIVTKLLLAIVGSLLYASVAGAQAPIMEGYVFNRHTGVPLAFVEVLLSREGSLDTAVARPVDTDSNGFYSIEIPLRELGSSLQLTATCRVVEANRRRVVTNAFTHPATVVDGTARRDLYLAASRRRAFSTCSKVFSPL